VATVGNDLKNFNRSFDLRKISKSIELAKPNLANSKKKTATHKPNSKMGKAVNVGG
jgi:hypothetical protein